MSRFEMHKSQYIKYIVDVLNGDKKFTHKYICDKIINHYFTRKYLIPVLDKKLDDRNVATRIGKGTDYAIKLVKQYIEYYKRKNKKFYVLKLDINKYFYFIDHNVLKEMLSKDILMDDFLFLSKIIDSTNYSYINDKIVKLLAKYSNFSLPLYEYGKGLPIGNLSSQCLSVYYLNRLDHYIIHNLKLKHYVRYMDDFLIFSEDKDYLFKCKNDIIYKLVNEYKLKINYKKTFITDINQGFIFLGYRFLLYNNKTIMLVKSDSIRNMKKKIKRNNNLFKKGLINFDKYFYSMCNYYFIYRCNRAKIKNIIDNEIM